MTKPVPNWAVWRFMPTLEPEKAVALSLGVEPDAVQHDSRGWMYIDDTRRSATSLPGFGDRLMLYRACHRTPISTKYLAAWALTVEWDVPIELARLAGPVRFPTFEPAPEEAIAAALVAEAVPGMEQELRDAIGKLGGTFVLHAGVPSLRVPSDMVMGDITPLSRGIVGSIMRSHGTIAELLRGSGASGGGAQSSQFMRVEQEPAMAPALMSHEQDQTEPRQLAVSWPKTSPSAAPATRPRVETNELAAAFAGLHGWDEAAWKRNLGQGRSDWLIQHRVTVGSPGRGGAQATWDAISIGRSLVDKGVATRSIRARFQTKLKHLADDWEENEKANGDHGL